MRLSLKHHSPNSAIQCEDLYIAEYTFVKENVAEITVEEGTVVKVIKKHDKESNPEWWLIEADHGRGYVPSSYLKPCGGVLASPTARENGIDVKDGCGKEKPRSLTGNEDYDENTVERKKMEKGLLEGSITHTDGCSDVFAMNTHDITYRVVYDFNGTDQQESSVSEGDIVRLLKIGDDSGNKEWCFIEYDGKQGYVPLNYLEPVNGISS